MTTFGDIVEPVSRNTWEDWDEISSFENNTQHLHWQESLDPPKEIESLFILEGKYLTDYVKMEIQSGLNLVNTIPQININLYKNVSKSSYVCIIKDYNVIESTDIIELLNEYISASHDVITIQTKYLPNYQTAEPLDQNCIVRKVSTSKVSVKSIDLKKLEQPNIISGVSAGVISLREHLNKPGMAVICYIEHPEEYRIEEVDNLLKQVDIVQKTVPRTGSVLSSNMYL